MRIGLVVMGGVDPSGRERVIPVLMTLIERLARRHDLHVFVLNQQAAPVTYSLFGATVHDLGRVAAPRGLRRRAQLARFVRAARAMPRFDLFHAYWALPAGFVATTAGRRLGTPTVVTASSGEWVAIPDIGYGLQRRWIDRRAVTLTMRRAARVTVCTQQMAGLARQHGVSTTTIPVGVVPPRETTVERSPGPPWRLVHVASLNPVKDQSTLLHAMDGIVARMPEVHLDIVGADTQRGAAAGLVDALGLARHVTFHGFQPSDAVARFYARAHVHLASSRHEGAGVATLEAAAAGVPTVGTNVGYVADWSPGGRAVAVPVGDANALADATVDLLRSADRRLEVARHARQWAVDHDADWTVDQFDGLYRDLRAPR